MSIALHNLDATFELVCYFTQDIHKRNKLNMFLTRSPLVSKSHAEGTILMIEPSACKAPIINTFVLSQPKTSWHVSWIGGHVFHRIFPVVFRSVKMIKMYHLRLKTLMLATAIRLMSSGAAFTTRCDVSSIFWSPNVMFLVKFSPNNTIWTENGHARRLCRNYFVGGCFGSLMPNHVRLKEKYIIKLDCR